MPTTLLQLKTLVFDRCDIPSDSGFGNELTSYINQAYDELYSLLIKTFSNYFIQTMNFTVNQGEDGYTLPDNVRYIYAVDGALSSGADNWYSVRRFMLPERNAFQPAIFGYNFVSEVPWGVSYNWIGRSIKFIPQRLAPASYRVWFVPTLTKLVDDADEVQFEMEPYLEFIIRDASSKLLMKQESIDQSMYWRDQTELYRRYVEGMAAERDEGQVERTVDTQNGGWSYY